MRGVEYNYDWRYASDESPLRLPIYESPSFRLTIYELTTAGPIWRYLREECLDNYGYGYDCDYDTITIATMIRSTTTTSRLENYD